MKFFHELNIDRLRFILMNELYIDEEEIDHLPDFTD